MAEYRYARGRIAESIEFIPQFSLAGYKYLCRARGDAGSESDYADLFCFNPDEVRYWYDEVKKFVEFIMAYEGCTCT